MNSVMSHSESCLYNSFLFESGAVVSAVTSKQEGPRFESESGGFCVEFACSVSAWVLWYSGFLPQFKNMQSGGRLIGDSKLPTGVDGCMCIV